MSTEQTSKNIFTCKLWYNASNQIKIRSSSCVAEDRRKGRRKKMKEDGEKKRKIEKDRDRKDIGNDKRQLRSMEV